MKQTLSITGIIMLLACTPACADYFSAQDDTGSQVFSDRPLDVRARATRVSGDVVTVPNRAQLVGTWTAENEDGGYIHFRIDGNGKFIFDQRHHTTPARLYMCGRIDTTPASLELQVQARKEMAATGDITESHGRESLELEVVSARQNRLVLDVGGRKMVFFRG